MDIKVNVPRGFVARYKWVDGDLVISIEPVASARIIKSGYKRHTAKGYFGAVELKGQAVTAGRGPLVVTVDTDERPVVARKGTGSTGPREKDNG